MQGEGLCQCQWVWFRQEAAARGWGWGGGGLARCGWVGVGGGAEVLVPSAAWLLCT